MSGTQTEKSDMSENVGYCCNQKNQKMQDIAVIWS